jgi:serine/threonine-protein kinase
MIERGTLLNGRYEILRALGSGGMGTVYQAHDRALDEPVAIKVLNPSFADDPEMARRFLAEIKLARRVTHRNVCRIHEYGEHEGRRFICMELVTGADLRRLIADRGGLPTEEAFELSIQVARGLQAIHEVGIVHRDLKTPNIMVDAIGVVRLMDFGIAKDASVDARSITMTGQLIGTPEYMSPEQARGERVDARSDIYSLGIVIFEVFTGRVPFRAETPIGTILKQIQEPPPLEGADASRLPPPLLPVLARLLAKDASRRYPSAAEVVHAVREARTASTGATAQATPPPFWSATAVVPVPALSPATVPSTSPAPSPAPDPPPTAVPRVAPTPVPSATAVSLPPPPRAATPRRAAPLAVRRSHRVHSAWPVVVPAVAGVGAVAAAVALFVLRDPGPPPSPPPSAVPTPAVSVMPPVPEPVLSMEPARVVGTIEAPEPTPAPVATPAARTAPAATPRPLATPAVRSTPPARTTPAAAPTPAPRGTPEPRRDPPSATPLPSAPAVAPSPPATQAPGEGQLQLRVKPWAQVSVDGRPVGTTPMRPLSLSEGPHSIRLEHPDYRPLQRRVTVRSGQTTELEVDLAWEAVPKKR